MTLAPGARVVEFPIVNLRPLRLAALFAFAACSTNPVTGRRELSLISESQEISMGLAAAQDISASIGLVPDSGLQQYVRGLGLNLARTSERPQLPWSFTVIDDPMVNAFALPGGPIFVTRGILAHMNSEAELVSVLGHEIGHITARHSVSQMSRAQLAQIGLVAAVIVKPELMEFGNLASQGLGLLFMKFGRDDETQSDELGFKYMTAAGYDPAQMTAMFRTLGRLSAGAQGRVPEWMSTHPDPGNRVQATERRIAATTLPANLKVERESFLRRTDGLVFGDNPRQGYFREQLFLHPDLRFQFNFPSGWKTANQMTQVVGASQQEDAIVVLTHAGEKTPSAALTEFDAIEGVQAGRSSSVSVNGLPAVSASFTASTQNGTLRGWVTFVSLDGGTFRLLTYTSSDRFGAYDSIMRTSVNSFRRLTDQAALSVQPARVALVRTTRAMTIPEFDRAYPSSISAVQLALINGLEPGATIPSGTLMKRVR